MNLLKEQHLHHPSHLGWYDGGADFRWRANASILWDYNDFVTSVNFRFLDDNKDDCWLSTYYGLNDGCSNPDEANNFGDYGYNLMEVEYYTDYASCISVLR